VVGHRRAGPERCRASTAPGAGRGHRGRASWPREEKGGGKKRREKRKEGKGKGKKKKKKRRKKRKGRKIEK
jgi:hypothetical protein